MPRVFTSDWFERNIEPWKLLFRGCPSEPDLHFLELGSFEGQSAIWLAENALTGEGSDILCVDSWKGRFSPARELFLKNIEGIPNIRWRWEDTSVALTMLAEEGERFDAVYIDADHRACSVLADAALAWPLLNVGGLLLFDDFEWTDDDGDGPRRAIEAFLAMQAGRFAPLRGNQHQVAVEKTRA